jgi:heparin binding hemagglutinin HbhA
MPTVPTIDDVRKASEQARTVVAGAFEQARTPLLAAIGAGDVATQAVLDAVNKARGQVSERAGRARSAVDDLPTDVAGLREKLDPAELRKLVDSYADAAAKLYTYLSEHGEKTLDRLRSQPQVKRAVEQFDQAAQAAQTRAETAVGDARELADEVLGKVTRRTRSTGEKTARAAEKLAGEVAEDVRAAGGDVAHEVRSTSRKAANRTAKAADEVSVTSKPTRGASTGKSTTSTGKATTTRRSSTQK